MGGQATGMLFGVVVPEGVPHLNNNYDGKGPGLLDTWKKENEDKIKTLEASGKLERFEFAQNRFVPDTECCCNVLLLGFWVAAGRSGKPGCPLMPEALALADLEMTEPYATAIDKARLRWRRFERWARKQGVKLPRARLMLAETEVG